jgi:hypothetical protein
MAIGKRRARQQLSNEFNVGMSGMGHQNVVLTNDLGERSVIGFDGSRHMFLSNEVGTEEHESISWIWNVTLRAALAWRGGICEKGELGPTREGKVSEWGMKDPSLTSHFPVQRR